MCNAFLCYDKGMKAPILTNVPVKWKLKEFLEREGVTAYALADKTHGKLSQNGVYRLTSGDLKGLRFESLEAILPALNELTGKRIQVSDLLEFDYIDDTPDA